MLCTIFNIEKAWSLFSICNLWTCQFLWIHMNLQIGWMTWGIRMRLNVYHPFKTQRVMAPAFSLAKHTDTAMESRAKLSKMAPAPSGNSKITPYQNSSVSCLEALFIQIEVFLFIPFFIRAVYVPHEQLGKLYPFDHAVVYVFWIQKTSLACRVSRE